jgi:anti-sigma factor RsiW
MTRRHEEQNLMQDYLDGRLTPEQHDRIVLHLSVCETCRSEMKVLKRIDTALRMQQLDSPGRHFTSLVMRQVLPASTPASFRVIEYAAYLFGFLIVVTTTITVLLLAGVIHTEGIPASSLSGEVAAYFRSTMGEMFGWVRRVLPFASMGSGGKVALLGALSLALVALVDRLYVRWSGHRS